MTRVDGVDVSHYQGIVDWVAVKASCARPDFAVAAWKVTQGARTVDATAARNRKDAKHAGFRWRFGYHWLSPNIDGVTQARWFLTNFANIGPNEAVILDCEEKGITADQALQFCEAVEGTTGRPVAVYCGVYGPGGIWRDTRIFNGERIRWVAAYVSETRVRAACQPFGFDVWQWSSAGTVPGVSTRCDVNLVENPIMLDLACSITQPQPPTPPTPLTPTDIEDDTMPIVTNKEQLFNDRPLSVKWVVTATGALRHLNETEWIARGSIPGTPITNAQIVQLGVA
jgi:lysozyme